MDKKRGPGLAVIIIGMFIIIIQSVSLTGAVIDVSTVVSNSGFIIGLALIIGGIVLFITEAPTIQSPVQDIWDQTTQFLREHGIDYVGRSKYEKEPNQYFQDKFEKSMKTGAFSSQRARHH